jgi:hypothetical protein
MFTSFGIGFTLFGKYWNMEVYDAHNKPLNYGTNREQTFPFKQLTLQNLWFHCFKVRILIIYTIYFYLHGQYSRHEFFRKNCIPPSPLSPTKVPCKPKNL